MRTPVVRFRQRKLRRRPLKEVEAARFTSLCSIVLRERVVLSGESRSGLTQRVLDSSRRGFDVTKSGSGFDERRLEEDQ
jgi:hypothetical protein